MRNAQATGTFCSYAVAQMRGQKEEDRFSANISHVNPQDGGLRNIASFGVFDGHSSNKAAEEAAKSLNSRIVLAFSELLTTTGLVGTLSQLPHSRVNDLLPTTQEASAHFLASSAKGITGSIHGSIHSGSLHSVQETAVGVSAFGSIGTIDADSDEEGFTIDASHWRTTGMAQKFNELGDLLDESMHSEVSAQSDAAQSSKTTLKSPSSPQSTRSRVAATPSEQRDKELLQENILLSAKKMNVLEVLDALMVEAVLKETHALDKRVKAFTSSGSTAVTLLLRKQADLSVRAMCSNVGDSRCVCITAASSVVECSGPTTPLTKTPKFADTRIIAAGTATPVSTAYRDLLIARNNADLKLTSIVQHDTDDAASLSTGTGTIFAGSKSAAFDGQEYPYPNRNMSTAAQADEQLPDVLYASKTSIAAAFLMSEDHNLSLPRERLRILTRTLPPWSPLPVESFEPYLPHELRSGLLVASNNETVSIFEVGALVAKKVSPYDALGTSGHGIAIPSSSSGHGVGLGGSDIRRWNSSLHLSVMADREADVENGITNMRNNTHLTGRSTSVDSMQADGVSLNIGQAVMSGYAKITSGQHIENAATRLGLASKFIKKVRMLMSKYGSSLRSWGTTTDLLSSARLVSDLEFIDDFEARNRSDSDSAYSTATDGVVTNGKFLQLLKRESFIARRVSADGKTIGPEALFGRQNVSIMMTRSIGDKMGPRSCVAFPEISAITVPPGHHARFVMASDGFWDVVSVDTVRLVALTKRFKSARVLALMLAQKAVRRRLRGGLRLDDVSVLIVDVNIDKITGSSVQKLAVFHDGSVLPMGRQGSCSIA